MNLKKSYMLILLVLMTFEMSACKKDSTATDGSVSEQDIQQMQVVENTSQLSIDDIDNKKQIVFETEGSYRILNEHALKNYNDQYKSFKTMKYFYNDDKDTSIAVVKVYPLKKSKEAYFSDFKNKVKKSFPNAEYTQGISSDKQYEYAAYSYVDSNHKLNNACNVMLTVDGKTVYSICAISPTQSIAFLKEAVKNISIKAITQ